MRLFDLKPKNFSGYEEDSSVVFDNLTALNAQYQATWRFASNKTVGLIFNAA